MKRIVSTFSILLFLLFVTKSFAQSDSTESYLLDFSVPDMPAFKALGTDPSEISRPSDIQKFAASLTPFYSGGTAIIPKNFALEIAPWKLASKKWTLETYRKKSFLYNSGFSMGTIRDTATYNSKLSVGYRVTFTSKKGDVLKSVYGYNKIASSNASMTLMIANLQTKWVTDVKGLTTPGERVTYIRTHLDEFIKYLAREGDGAIKTNSMKDEYKVLVDSLKKWKINVKDFLKDSASYMKARSENVDALYAQFKKYAWNATRTDLAMALTSESSDTILKGVQFSSFNLWLTQSIAIDTGQQLLIGINAKLPRTEPKDSIDMKINGSVGLRYYIGTKDVRGFLETQYTYRNYEKFENKLLVNLGAEFRLGPKFWIIAGAGVDNFLGDKGFSRLVSSFNLRYAFNERTK